MEYVDLKTKEQFFNEIAKLRKDDPRLLNTTVSRLLKHSGNYLSSLSNGANRPLSVDTYNLWEEKVKPQLEKRIAVYHQISDAELREQCRVIYKNNGDLVAKKLNVSKKSLDNMIRRASSTRGGLLNIYDANAGLPLYPSNKRQTMERDYPKAVKKLRSELDELSEYGITLKGASFALKIGYGSLMRFLSSRNLNARRSLSIHQLIKKVIEYQNIVKNMQPVYSPYDLKKNYFMDEEIINDLLKQMGKNENGKYFDVSGRNLYKRCMELAFIRLIQIKEQFPEKQIKIRYIKYSKKEQKKRILNKEYIFKLDSMTQAQYQNQLNEGTIGISQSTVSENRNHFVIMEIGKFDQEEHKVLKIIKLSSKNLNDNEELKKLCNKT